MFVLPHRQRATPLKRIPATQINARQRPDNPAIPGRAITHYPTTLDRPIESEIERFVRFPDTLSVSVQSEIAGLIETNSLECDLAGFFRSYYLELDGIDAPVLICES